MNKATSDAAPANPAQRGAQDGGSTPRRLEGTVFNYTRFCRFGTSSLEYRALRACGDFGNFRSGLSGGASSGGGEMSES